METIDSMVEVMERHDALAQHEVLSDTSTALPDCLDWQEDDELDFEVLCVEFEAGDASPR